MEENFPPKGYVPAPSQVPGIEVYAAAAKEENRPDLVDFKCPRCGATIAYSVETGKLSCAYCGYSEALDVQKVGHSAQEFEFTVDTVQRSQNGWGEDRRELACQRCGGVVSVPQNTLSYSCPFCGSNKVLFREPLEDVLRPRYLIPFQLDSQACRSITHQWLGSSWMTPAELKNAAPDKFYPIYIPYWTFDASANATWKAMVGHEKVEVYTDEHGDRRERRTIDWKPEAGKIQKVFNDLLVPGTKRLKLSTLGRIDAFNMRDLTLYEPGLLAGMHAQSYDLPLEEAWDAGRQILRERVHQACLDRINSNYIRNFNMLLDFSNEQWRYILTPIYTSVYQYDDQPFQILINGQTGKIAGQRPVDWLKVWLVIAAILSPGVLLGIAALLLANPSDSQVSGGLGLFLLAVGLVFSFFILRQAQEMSHA